MKQSLRVSVLGIAALLASAAMMPQWVVGGEVGEHGCTTQITSCPAETITVTAESMFSKGTPCGYEVPDLRDQVVVDFCGEEFIRCIDQMPAPGTVVGIGDTVITLLAYQCEDIVMPAFGDPDTCTNDETCSQIAGSCTTTLTVEPPEPELNCDVEFDPINVDASCLVTVPDITGEVTVEACPGVMYTVVQSPPAGSSIFPQFGNELQITVSLEEFPNVSCNAYIRVLPLTECPIGEKLIAEGPDSCMAELPNYCNAYLVDCLVVEVTEARGDQDFFELTCDQSPAPGTMLNIGSTDVTLTVSECFFDLPAVEAVGDPECFVVADYTCTFPVTVNAPTPELICDDFITTLDPVVLEDDCLFTVPDVTGEVMVDACDGAEYELVQFPEAGAQIEISSPSLIIEVYLDGEEIRPCLIEIPFNPVQSCPDSPQEIAYDENCEATIPDLTGELDIMDCCEEFVGKGVEQLGPGYGNYYCGEIRITQIPEAGGALTEPTEVSLIVERCFVFQDEQLLQRGIEDGCDLVDSCTVMLIPVDNTPPTFTCPDDLAVNADENCMGVVPDVTGVVDASDNCTASADLTITQDPAAGTVIGLGTTLFTVTVTDAAGNTESCTVMVELLENGCMDEPPAGDDPPGDEEPGAPQPVPGCDSDNQSLNLLFSLLFHSPVCGATCPLMLTLTLCGISALRLRKRRRNR